MRCSAIYNYWSILIALLFSSLMLITSPLAMADSEDYPPVLIDADKLTSVAPQQAKQFARNYISKTTSIARTNESSTTQSEPLSKGQNNGQFNHNLIFAYKILAQAEFHIGDYHASLSNIDKSISLAKEFDFQIALIDATLIKAELVWAMTEDAERTKKLLTPVDELISSLPNDDSVKENQFEFLLTKGALTSQFEDLEKAQLIFDDASKLLPENTTDSRTIRLNIEYAKFYLQSQRFNSALKVLLESYWTAIELDLGDLLAQVNSLLADLYYERGLYSNAQEHLSQAASFYGKYEQSIYFASVVKRLADVYYIQGKYNLALVQYFNVLDHEMAERDIENIIAIRLKLARTYLQLYNFPLAEQYLQRASDLLIYSDTPEFLPAALYLQAMLAYSLAEYENAVEWGEASLEASTTLDNPLTRLETLNVLSDAYIALNKPDAALEYLTEHNKLRDMQISRWQTLNSKAFLNQINSVEQSIHYKSQVQELTDMHLRYDSFQRSSYILAVFAFTLTVVIFFAFWQLSKSKKRERSLTKDLYTHTRSGLQNLKMMHISLRSSLKQSRHAMEQWKMGELINEPLNDRLRFAMVELPFLTEAYLQQGYRIGLDIDKAFGSHVKEQIPELARLYHFSDSLFLYIEPNPEQNSNPQEMIDRIQNWVHSFNQSKPINTNINIGLADYPFLPRAYTAINDTELIDILLLSVELAREHQAKEPASQWVHLQAITHAPAASFVGDSIRQACQQAIKQGLVKIHSSFDNEENINI